MRFRYNGNWYVTFFPIETLVTTDQAKRELMAWAFKSKKYKRSITHKISQQTLEKKLNKIHCSIQKKWFFFLGPRARLFSRKSKNGIIPFRELQEQLTKASERKQLALLYDWDVHDVMIVAKKHGD